MKSRILTGPPDASVLSDWESFLADAILPTHYITPVYFDDPFVRGGERFVVHALADDGSIAAVLSGVDAGETVFCGLPSRPQLSFRRGINGDEAVDALVEGLFEKSDAGLIRIFSWEAADQFKKHGFTSSVTHDANEVVMLDLADGAEAIFKRFSQTRRNEIRKAEKGGALEIKQLDNEDELAALYQIHVDWNKRKGNQPDTFDEQRRAFEQKNHRTIFIAKSEGKVIAGSYFRFCRGGAVEYAANNSLTEFQKLRPNDVIVWHAIKWACQNGFSHFSMGGAHLFLRRFGGEVVRTHRYSLDRTFLRRHEKREQLNKLVKQAYRATPEPLKRKIKSIVKR